MKQSPVRRHPCSSACVSEYSQVSEEPAKAKGRRNRKPTTHFSTPAGSNVSQKLFESQLQMIPKRHPSVCLLCLLLGRRPRAGADFVEGVFLEDGAVFEDVDEKVIVGVACGPHFGFPHAA